VCQVIRSIVLNTFKVADVNDMRMMY